ncbi:hypothetical protein G7Y79_00055g089400 [Physcia stellaris]|nr:hypothetical protein G7Y79_00055g089400 [Physcia stellaris]
MTTPISAVKSASASTSAPDFLPFSSALCDHVPEGHPMTQDLKTLYSMHLTGDAKALRCSWFTQAKRAQESYHLRKHELEVKNKLKEEMKQLTKQKEEVRLVRKRAEGYTCRRCKSKFDSNIKLHEHIRTRHAKKPKPAQQSVVSPASESKPPTPPASSPESVTSSPPTERITEISSRVTSYFTRILVGCNTKETDILGRNRLTATRCTEALSSPDCDTQIGVQILGECKHCLPANSASYPVTETPRHSDPEALFDSGRPTPHVRWEAESIWPAAAPNALVLSARPWQMQSRKQMWPHTKPHYVILQCGGLTCFQIGQIRSIWANTCPRKPSAPVFGLALGLTYLFSFSIPNGLSPTSCLQALPRAFRHLLAYRLGHAKCLKSWEQWDTHGDALLAFRSSPPYFGGVLTSSGSLLWGVSMLFVVLPARPPY